MSTNIDNPNRTPKNKVLAGVILLLVGGALLIRQLDFFLFPHWLISWPMLLIVWGLYSGTKHNWRKPVWFILVVIGVCFLIDDVFPSFDVAGMVWPALLISFGVWIILRNRINHADFDSDYWDKRYKANPTDSAAYTATDAETGFTSSTIPPVEPLSGVPPVSEDDYLNATAIFGGVNKTILSKNFRGGDITNIFGGTEIDLTRADINGRVVIDITQVFGGTKIFVPANWHVVPDLAAVFAGVDDKRVKINQPASTEKTLVLKGVSLFAGVDIRSY